MTAIDFSMLIDVKSERTQPFEILLDDSVYCWIRTAKLRTMTNKNCILQAASNTWV